ncbi:LacI family DNA-binding transcriptional regulator [Lacisediminihabitans changchengi]|uniref:LacI family DNA-binding transcriptional regulator n=1 Tax=Lacisediminihabitans changchengi TaxID=2787634 RepID=UPI0027DAE2D7|nr:LacI family DNA-binding transcriptional regulator [Lacisediminihabitans changchengi]
MSDVAARAEVSVGTVSNVLNRPEVVSLATRERVQAVITAMNYVPNERARQLRAGTSSTIGFVMLDAGNPFFMEVARGAERSASALGLTVLLGNSDADSEREENYLAAFELQRVRGVLVSPTRDISTRVRSLRERRIPSILIGRAHTPVEATSVSVDDVAGGQLAVQHLVDLGRTRVAFVAGPLHIRQVTDRLAGAQAAIAGSAAATLELLSAPPVSIQALSIQAGRLVGQEIADRPKARRPDAIFAANDLLALGILEAFAMSGSAIRVPDDIALVGYDDIMYARSAVVPITSVRQPSAEMGSTAIRLLLEEASDLSIAPREVVFQPELIERASTVPVTVTGMMTVTGPS